MTYCQIQILIWQVLLSLQNTSTNLFKRNPALSFFAKWEGIVKRRKCLVISWKLWAVLPQRYILNCPFPVHCLCYYLCSNLRPQDYILFLTGSCTSFLCYLHTAARFISLSRTLSLSFTWLQTFHNFLWTMMRERPKFLALPLYVIESYLWRIFVCLFYFICLHSPHVSWQDMTYMVIIAQQSCYWTTWSLWLLWTPGPPETWRKQCPKHTCNPCLVQLLERCAQ